MCSTSTVCGLKFGIMYVYKATVEALTRPHSVKIGEIILRRMEYFIRASVQLLLTGRAKPMGGSRCSVRRNPSQYCVLSIMGLTQRAFLMDINIKVRIPSSLK